MLAFRAVHRIDTVTISWRDIPKTASTPHPLASEKVSWGPVPAGVGETPEAKAARLAIEDLAARIGGVGGIILLGPAGIPGFAFNTPRMARGYWIEGMDRGIVEIDTI
jgi:hypothetical protein